MNMVQCDITTQMVWNLMISLPLLQTLSVVIYFVNLTPEYSVVFGNIIEEATHFSQWDARDVLLWRQEDLPYQGLLFFKEKIGTYKVLQIYKLKYLSLTKWDRKIHWDLCITDLRYLCTSVLINYYIHVQKLWYFIYRQHQ